MSSDPNPFGGTPPPVPSGAAAVPVPVTPPTTLKTIADFVNDFKNLNYIVELSEIFNASPVLSDSNLAPEPVNLLSIGRHKMVNPFDKSFSSELSIKEKVIVAYYTTLNQKNPQEVLLAIPPADIFQKEIGNGIDLQHYLLGQRCRLSANTRLMRIADAVTDTANVIQVLLNELMKVVLSSGNSGTIFDACCQDLANTLAVWIVFHSQVASNLELIRESISLISGVQSFFRGKFLQSVEMTNESSNSIFSSWFNSNAYCNAPSNVVAERALAVLHSLGPRLGRFVDDMNSVGITKLEEVRVTLLVWSSCQLSTLLSSVGLRKGAVAALKNALSSPLFVSTAKHYNDLVSDSDNASVSSSSSADESQQVLGSPRANGDGSSNVFHELAVHPLYYSYGRLLLELYLLYETIGNRTESYATLSDLHEIHQFRMKHHGDRSIDKDYIRSRSNIHFNHASNMKSTKTQDPQFSLFESEAMFLQQLRRAASNAHNRGSSASEAAMSAQLALLAYRPVLHRVVSSCSPRGDPVSPISLISSEMSTCSLFLATASVPLTGWNPLELASNGGSLLIKAIRHSLIPPRPAGPNGVIPPSPQPEVLARDLLFILLRSAPILFGCAESGLAAELLGVLDPKDFTTRRVFASVLQEFGIHIKGLVD